MRRTLVLLAALLCTHCAAPLMRTIAFVSQQDMLTDADMAFTQEVQGTAFAPYVSRLTAVAEQHGLVVLTADINGSDGVLAAGLWGLYSPKYHFIAIQHFLTPNEQVLTLAHELGHALGPQDLDPPDDDIVAQAVSGIFCQRIGMKNAAFATNAYFRWIPREYRDRILLRYTREIDATVDLIQHEMPSV